MSLESPTSARKAWQVGVGFATDVGLVRERNEDALGVYVPYAGENSLGPVDAVFAVADGMGGHAGGDLAARFVAQAVEQELAASSTPSPRDLGAWLQGFLRRVNRELLALAALQGDASPLGSTLTMAALRDGRLHVAHVGDSRLYELRGSILAQRTPDHSWVAEQVRAGTLTPEQAARHPDRNLLTECLGVDAQLSPHVGDIVLSDDVRFLLCTDGVHGSLADETIADVLVREIDPQRAADRLIGLARAAGGHDNATALVFDVRRVSQLATTLSGAPDPAPGARPDGSRLRKVHGSLQRPDLSRLLLLGGGVLVLAALALCGWLLLGPVGVPGGIVPGNPPSEAAAVEAGSPAVVEPPPSPPIHDSQPPVSGGPSAASARRKAP